MTNSQPDCMTYSQPVPNSSRSQQSPYVHPTKEKSALPSEGACCSQHEKKSILTMQRHKYSVAKVYWGVFFLPPIKFVCNSTYKNNQ